MLVAKPRRTEITRLTSGGKLGLVIFVRGPCARELGPSQVPTSGSVRVQGRGSGKTSASRCRAESWRSCVKRNPKRCARQGKKVRGETSRSFFSFFFFFFTTASNKLELRRVRNNWPPPAIRIDAGRAIAKFLSRYRAFREGPRGRAPKGRKNPK
jgi:hypothetical protein